MNNLKYKEIAHLLDGIIPEVVCCNSLLFRATDKGYLQRNYARITEMMVVRFWLYLDLNPNPSKALNWLKVYTQLDTQLCEDAWASIYEFFRRENLLTFRVSQFKAAFKSMKPSVSYMLGPVWSRVEALFLQDKGLVSESDYIDVVRLVVQWTRVSSKLKLEMPSLEEEAYQRFEANELRLRDLWSKPDEVRDQYLAEMRDILSTWIDMRNFTPGPGHHGSGAVAEKVGRKSYQKHLEMGAADCATKFFDKRFNFVFIPDYHMTWQLPKNSKIQRESRPATVPKNVKKVRMISMQPTGLMYRQEAVLQGYYQQWSNPPVKKHFPIFDRTVNQSWALTASRSGDKVSMATLDLQSASDSVSVHLIKGCTYGNLRVALLTNRVKTIGFVDLKETYATMGDASVFPTETLLIGAAVQLAISHARKDDPYVSNRFVVFGDDIICPNNYFVLKHIHDIFSRIGFIINDDKSFINGPYRESCGVEAYLGYEIQPWYFRTEPEGDERLMSLIGAANECYHRGYRLVRRYFINAYALQCRCSVDLLPFTENAQDTSRFLTDTLTRGRFRLVHTPEGEKCYGQYERCELTLKTRVGRVPWHLSTLEEAYRLNLWLYEHEADKPKSKADIDENISSKPGPSTVCKCRRWVSVLDLQT